MIPRSRLLGRRVVLSLTRVLSIALVVPFLAASTAAAQAGARHEQLTGTVMTADPRGRTIDLVTGVGYALRVRRLHLPAGVDIKAQGVAVEFSRLTPGCVVRTECAISRAGAVASAVELIRGAPGSRAP